MFLYLRVTPGFALAVEMLRRADLPSCAVVMSGLFGRQGFVCEMNSAAQHCGVRFGMTLTQARRYCPDLVVLSPDLPHYQEMWERMSGILAIHTPLVQPLKMGEAVCDLNGCERHWHDDRQAAREIQLQIREATGIVACIGVGSNRLVADLASRTPDSDDISIVSPGQERQFLAPLPVSVLPGIDSRIELAFQVLGLRTLGQLATIPAAAVRQRFGVVGEQLHSYACGIDPRPVVPPSPRLSAAARYQCEDGSFDEAVRALQELTESCAATLQERGAAGKLLELTLEWSTRSSNRLLPVRVRRPLLAAGPECQENVPPSQTPVSLPREPEREALRLPSRIHSRLPQPARTPDRISKIESEHPLRDINQKLLPSARSAVIPAILESEVGTVMSARLALRVPVNTSAAIFEHAQRLLLRRWPASSPQSRLYALSLEVGEFEAPAQLAFAEFDRLDQVGRLRGISVDRLQALVEQEQILSTRHGQEPFRHVATIDPSNVLAERRFQWRDGLQWETLNADKGRSSGRRKRRALPPSGKKA